jgi:predicted amidohydrolase YtcJ
LLRQRAAAGQLKLRIYGMARGSDEAFMARLRATGPLLDAGGPSEGHYVLRAVKLFADGALGSRGAALLAPYSDAPQTRGLLFQPDAVLHAQMRAAAKAGFQVNVHAIGDAANRQALAGFEALQQELGARSTALRHRIEHAQVIALADIPRFAKDQVIASVQPTHATSDMNMAEDRVGPQRIQGAYAWQRLLKSGARLACGSDFPVEEPSPWAGLYAAITREDASGKPVGGWYRQQALNPVQALDCFTRGAAFAGHAEHDVGSLTPGHRADFILVDRDPLTASPAALLKTRVLQTWVGGRLVYQGQD